MGMYGLRFLNHAPVPKDAFQAFWWPYLRDPKPMVLDMPEFTIDWTPQKLGRGLPGVPHISGGQEFIADEWNIRAFAALKECFRRRRIDAQFTTPEKVNPNLTFDQFETEAEQWKTKHHVSAYHLESGARVAALRFVEPVKVVDSSRSISGRSLSTYGEGERDNARVRPRRLAPGRGSHASCRQRKAPASLFAASPPGGPPVGRELRTRLRVR